jgi:hypothetical protein
MREGRIEGEIWRKRRMKKVDDVLCSVVILWIRGEKYVEGKD